MTWGVHQQVHSVKKMSSLVVVEEVWKLMKNLIPQPPSRACCAPSGHSPKQQQEPLPLHASSARTSPPSTHSGAPRPTPTFLEKNQSIENSSKAVWLSHNVALGVSQQTPCPIHPGFWEFPLSKCGCGCWAPPIHGTNGWNSQENRNSQWYPQGSKEKNPRKDHLWRQLWCWWELS